MNKIEKKGILTPRKAKCLRGFKKRLQKLVNLKIKDKPLGKTSRRSSRPKTPLNLDLRREIPAEETYQTLTSRNKTSKCEEEKTSKLKSRNLPAFMRIYQSKGFKTVQNSRSNSRQKSRGKKEITKNFVLKKQEVRRNSLLAVLLMRDNVARVRTSASEYLY